MCKILIVDYDNLQINIIRNTILNNYPSWHVETADNLETASALIDASIQNQLPFSHFLFDVQLSDNDQNRDGFLLAQKLRSFPVYFRTPLLFLTSVPDTNYFALSNYHCYNYILKPYTADDIILQLKQILMEGYIEHNSIIINDTNRIIHNIQTTSIYAVESRAHILVLHTDNGSISTRQFSLKAIIPLLGSTFVRCHKRYIINLHHLKNFDCASRIINVNGNPIPIGDSYIQNIKHILHDF